MSTPTSNMGLTLSTIGVDSGLNWEMNLNSSLLTIDSHNHSSGSGVQITPAGLNINSSLSLNNQQLTNTQAVLFANQSSLATVNALYTIAGELYYNDPTGAVQITLGGNVNATSSGITGSGGASASFTSGTLVVNSASNTPGPIKAGSILIGQNIAGSNYLTLNPPSALSGGSYALTLPTIPAAQNFMAIDASGNIVAYAPVAGGLVNANYQNGSITGAKIGSATITGSNIAAETIALSNLVGTIQSVTITASTGLTGGGTINLGGTAVLGLNIAPSSVGSFIFAYSVAGTSSSYGTTISGSQLLPCSATGGTGSPGTGIFPGTWYCMGSSDGGVSTGPAAATLWQRLA